MLQIMVLIVAVSIIINTVVVVGCMWYQMRKSQPRKGAKLDASRTDLLRKLSETQPPEQTYATVALKPWFVSM